MVVSIYITHEVVEMSDLAAVASVPDWRATAISRLQNYGIRVVNPIDWAIPVARHESEGVKKQVKRALDLIDMSDGILANLHRSTYGTAMEIFYAHRQGKMVTVVGQSPFSPWVVSHSQARFGDLEHALEYIIEESRNPDLLSWTLQFEGQLSERYEQFPSSGEPDYQFYGGELPVLVAAPHATSYFHEGILQDADTYTGALVTSVARISRCHGLTSSHCQAADPMHHSQAPVVSAMADIARAGRVGLVILVVGLPWHESCGFVLESSPDSRALEPARRLKLKLSELDETLLKEEISPGTQVLTNFLSQTLDLPVIVLKVHRRFRVPRLQPEPFQDLVGSLSEIVSQTGIELYRSMS